MDPTAGRDATGGRPEEAAPAGATAALTEALDGRWGSLRREVRAQLASAGMRDGSGLPIEEYRRQVFDDLHLLAKTAPARLGFDREYGGMSDPAGSVVAHEMLGFGDLSLMVKAGVQWGLFGGAVQLLGTRRHHERYLRDIMDLQLAGCFAMTETGHGSDVQHLRTTATYDPAASEFVISTPDDGGAQGLHRQRGPRRPDGGRLRPAHRRRHRARRARPAGADPGRRRPPAARGDASRTAGARAA